MVCNQCLYAAFSKHLTQRFFKGSKLSPQMFEDGKSSFIVASLG